MNLYKKHTNRELLSVFKDIHTLTYEAKIQLKDEALSRKLVVDIDDLNNSIVKESEAINNLEYLRDLVSISTGIGDTIRVVRTVSAKTFDVVAIVLGGILSYYGLVRLIKIIFDFLSDRPFDLTAFLIDGFIVVLGYVGFKMLSGFKRLIDHMGFELLSEDGIVRLKKRFDMTLIEEEFTPENVSVKESGGEIALFLNNIEVITGDSSNLIQRMTIQELAVKIKNNEEEIQDA
jgi:hypothetical protein